MDSLWLKTILRAKKITQRSLGEAIGLPQDKINKALAHVRQFSPIEAIKIAEFLEEYQVPRSETLNAILGKDAVYLQRVGESKDSNFKPLASTNSKSIPIIGTISGAGAVTYFDATTKREFADAVSSSATSLVALRVEGEGLAPTYRHGDILYYDDHGKLENLAINKEAIVELLDGQKFLRILKRSPMESRFHLEATNSPTTEFVSLKSASRILWVRKA
jgi:hypothetical protein